MRRQAPSPAARLPAAGFPPTVPALPESVRSALSSALVLAALSTNLFGAETPGSPSASGGTIDFARDIQPILENSCLRCHGPERPKSRFRLDSREHLLKGGDTGIAVIPGDSTKSPLVQYISHQVEDMEMPPVGKGDPLTSEQIALIRDWIDQGAPWAPETGSAKQTLTFSVSPSIGWISVSGNEAMFREHTWLREGWNGGFHEFSLDQWLRDDTRVTADGRFSANDQNYRFRLQVEKQDFGFVRFGFEHFRRYYDNTGGFFEPLGTFALGQDLSMDNGRAWVDLGLTLPQWPRMTLGYEYQFRDGAKSMLQWGEVGDADGNSSGVYPASKTVDETVHLVKFDLDHQVSGIRIEDDFRGEFYDLKTRRTNTDFATVTGGPDTLTQVNERQDHFQGANALRLEKQVRDWLLISAGHLYSKLVGDATFNLYGLQPGDPATLLFTGDNSEMITIDRRSHVVNGNASMGPWQGLLFTAGVQSDWTRDQGFGQAFVPGFPDASPKIYSSSRDRSTTQELFGLRYTGIPFTVLFAESRYAQEGIDHFEQQSVEDGFGDSQDFLRDTDATSDLKDHRIGVSVSPWAKVSLHSSFKHRLKQNDFDHALDSDGSTEPGNGYSAFIRNRDMKTDELETKLVVHWMPALKTTLKYRLTATDTTSVTDPATTIAFDPVTFLPMDQVLPGGSVLAGNYDAHIYSLGTSLTPWRRLRLTSTVSFTDSRLRTGINNGDTILPYQGEIWSALSTANLALTDRTDWTSSHSFSRADYRQRSHGLTQPFGIVYDRHGVITGLTRRFDRPITANLQYGYFRYDEPTSGGARNYNAHAVMASMNIRLP